MLLGFQVIAADIVLTWDRPLLREDGSNITALESYKLYHSVDNVLTPVLVIPESELTYTLLNVSTGIHTFQISSVEAGLEGALSDPISITLSDLPPSPTAKIILTIECVNCAGVGMQ